MDGAGFMETTIPTNMKPTLIITHPGRAHRDDFLAVCWLLAGADSAHQYQVYRKEPEPTELDDSEVWVLDCGGRHEPHFRNFDHHQFDADAEPSCALQLLLEYELGEAAAHDTFTWLKPTAVHDSKGPKAMQQIYGVTPEIYRATVSPTETALHEMFAKVDFLDESAPLYHVMSAIGRQLWERANGLKAAISAVKVVPRQLDDLRVMLADPASVLSMPSPHFLPEVMDIKRREMIAGGFDPHVSISPNMDSRGKSWALYRYDETGRIDFFRLDKRQHVQFAHANGFLAKIDWECDMEQLFGFVMQADTALDKHAL